MIGERILHGEQTYMPAVVVRGAMECNQSIAYDDCTVWLIKINQSHHGGWTDERERIARPSDGLVCRRLECIMIGIDHSTQEEGYTWLISETVMVAYCIMIKLQNGFVLVLHFAESVDRRTFWL